MEYYSTVDIIYKTVEDIFNAHKDFEFYEKGSPFYKKDSLYLEEIYVEYDKINHIPTKILYYWHIPEDLYIDGPPYNYSIKNFEKME